MGRQFFDYEYITSGGVVGFLRPAFMRRSAATYDAFTQEPCVLRLKVTNPNSVYLHITVTDGGSNTVEADIYYNAGDTQYFDTTEILRHAMTRAVPSYTPADNGVQWSVELAVRDASDNTLSTDALTLYAYDAAAVAPALYYDPLPDTFRMIADASLANYETACTRQIEGNTDQVLIYDQAGNLLRTSTLPTNSYATAAWRFAYNALALPSLVDVGGQQARVVWETCEKDRAMIRWWSPVFGGYKSVTVELRAHAAKVTASGDYIKSFDNVWARAGELSASARVPLCTLRDYNYYCDLYLSDEVEIYWNTREPYARRVKVTGTPPVAPEVGTVDLEFDVMLLEVGEVW